jgi:hypothetical protein
LRLTAFHGQTAIRFMSRMADTLISFGALFVSIALIAPRLPAQTPDELRRAFIDLHDDKVPHNCEDATEWLFKYREQLKGELIDELYKTDWQGRSAICHVLYNTTSFEPDERFIRQTFSLLRQDEIPGNAEETSKWLAQRGDQIKPLLLDELYKTDEQGRHEISHLLYEIKSFVPDDRFIRFIGAKLVEADTDDGDWKFVHDHFDAFEPLLGTAIANSRNRPHDMYLLWATTWVMKKRGVLEHFSNVFTPGVVTAAATHLRNDDERSNAGWAVRFFLLLGNRALGPLREVAHSNDPQARSLANATIDALGGSRKAFGYLQARVELSRTPFGPEVSDPDWLAQAAEPYRGNDKAYDAR